MVARSVASGRTAKADGDAEGEPSPFAALHDAAARLIASKTIEQAAIDELLVQASVVATRVPSVRVSSFRRLMSGFSRAESAGKRRARLAGVLRACRLFEESARGGGVLDVDARIELMPGLGASVARKLAAQGVRTVGDLLLSPPRALLDLRAPLSGKALLDELARAPKQVIAVRGVVGRVSLVPLRGRRAVVVVLECDGVLVELWWFFFYAGARKLSGEVVAVGAPTPAKKRPGVLRIAHPRIVPLARVGGLEPIYAFEGVSSARIVESLSETLAAIDVASLDPVPAPMRASTSSARAGASTGTATGVSRGTPMSALMASVHTPKDPDEHHRARAELRQKMAWAEACWLVIRRLERERALGGLRAPKLPIDARARDALLSALGFSPTSSQRRAIDALGAMFDVARPMRALLTGDVGTGKTAVILAIAAQAVAAGTQVAILAPTTILAEQYLDASGPLARAIDARIALLPRATGRDRAGHARVAGAVRRGEVDVVVGTHALLQDSVHFHRLGLVVVDEQHRLGVAQRLSLVAKGSTELAPHLLTVSATPIPRTLALALRGEIDNVHLDERPKGRLSPTTTIVARSAFDEVRGEIERTLARDESVFVVCSNIEPRTLDDGTVDESSSPGAIARAKELEKRFGGLRVALVHGALDDDDRRAAIASFRRGDARILVGTSILEVGLDVPAATLMVIDGADRFGMAQVHQLRGRVGRGDRLGRCVLVHGEPLTDLARARLDALCRHSDGLEVAREDLRLRGAGDLEGARQSGEAAGFCFLDPLGDESLIARAEGDVVKIASLDPTLSTQEFSGFRRALSRFDAWAEARDLGLARQEAG